MPMHYPMRLAPVDDQTRRRIDEQALRWRMLYGWWQEDLRNRIIEEVGEQRASAWGKPDTGACLLRSACEAVATLHDGPALIHHDSDAARVRMRELAQSAGYHTLMPRVHRDAIAIRETLVHGERRADGTVRLVQVHPHEVEIDPMPDDPERPGRIKWWRLRKRDGRQLEWTCDVWSIIPGEEAYYIQSENGEDRSTEYAMLDGAPAPRGGYLGAAYPFRDASGAYLPWVLVHAQRTGQMWDYSSMSEIVDATLSIGKLWTYWQHLVQTASWPQRYLLNGYVAGLNLEGSGANARTVAISDPAVLLRIMQDPDSDASPSIQQDSTNADPMQLGEAIAHYERRAIALAGLNPADVIRQSGDPRSGYALGIKRDAQREAQRRYAPIFRPYDEAVVDMIGKLAAIIGDGYRVEYASIPLDTSERIDLQRYVDGEVASGRMSALQAYLMLHPEISETDAQLELDAIAALRAPEGRGGLLFGQMDAVLSVVRDVSSGVIPRDAGIALISSFLVVDQVTAQTLMGTAGMEAKNGPADSADPDPAGFDADDLDSDDSDD